VLGLLKAKGKGSVEGVLAIRWWLAISGLAAGLAVATKVAHVVVVVPLFFWVAVLGWRRARRRGWVVDTLYWSFFLSVWLAAIAAYNWSRFGGLFETGYGKEAGKFTAEFAVGFFGLLASPAKGVFWYCPVLLLSLSAQGHSGGATACAPWRFWRRVRPGYC
jgi:4-amino-4-deoxy-L-arabinose transferase-like glycosyltransferase